MFQKDDPVYIYRDEIVYKYPDDNLTIQEEIPVVRNRTNEALIDAYFERGSKIKILNGRMQSIRDLKSKHESGEKERVD